MSFWSQAARASLRRGGEIAREKGLLPPKPDPMPTDMAPVCLEGDGERTFTIWACPEPGCDEYDIATYDDRCASMLCAKNGHPPAIRTEAMPVTDHQAKLAEKDREIEEARKALHFADHTGGEESIVETARVAAQCFAHVEHRADAAERQRDDAQGLVEKAEERLREIESKLESGYAFCHPEDDCAGQRKWLEVADALTDERERASKLEGLLENGAELIKRLTRRPRFGHTGVPVVFYGHLKREIEDEVGDFLSAAKQYQEDADAHQAQHSQGDGEGPLDPVAQRMVEEGPDPVTPERYRKALEVVERVFDEASDDQPPAPQGEERDPTDLGHPPKSCSDWFFQPRPGRSLHAADVRLDQPSQDTEEGR